MSVTTRVCPLAPSKAMSVSWSGVVLETKRKVEAGSAFAAPPSAPLDPLDTLDPLDPPSPPEDPDDVPLPGDAPAPVHAWANVPSITAVANPEAMARARISRG